jgi:hypothetical protein
MTHLGAYQLGPGHPMTETAWTWPLLFVQRETEPGHLMGEKLTQAHIVCAQCQQSCFCLTPDVMRGSYALIGQQIIAGVLAHLKISHEDALPRT